MKNEGGQEAGYCSKIVFGPWRSLILMAHRCTYWRTNAPCAITNGAPNMHEKWTKMLGFGIDKTGRNHSVRQ